MITQGVLLWPRHMRGQNLRGVHPDLTLVLEVLAKRGWDFCVLEGLRTLDRQRKLFKAGATKTLNSRHLTGHAVDIAPMFEGEPSFHWPHYHPLAQAMKAVAADVDVKVVWGGDWSRFRDGPHWELCRLSYDEKEYDHAKAV
jgi:peptidoglycan L-alanyl-D-glutamate endopeptidase CwlK